VPTLPQQTSISTFSDDGEATKVIVVVEYAGPEDLQKVIEMGIEQGIAMAHDQLEALLHSSRRPPPTDG
jgi:hypothetical protein